MLQSDLYDYSDTYIVVWRAIIVTGANNGKRKNRSLELKNNARFISRILKINNVLIDNAEDLGVAMLMYSLIECSGSYRKITGNLWNHYRHEPNNPPADNYNADP